MKTPIEPNYGYLLISFAIDMIFYGISLVLVLLYFRRFGRRDALSRASVTVSILVFFSTVQVCAFSKWVYESLIDHFDDLESRDNLPPSSIILLFADYIVSFIAQCFFVSQIWTVSQHNRWYTTPVAIMALMNIAPGIAQTVGVARRPTVSGMDNKSDQILAITQTIAAALCDISITASLCFLLNRSRTGFKSTETIIDSLIIFAVNRGLAASLLALISLILYDSNAPDLSMYAAPHIIQGLELTIHEVHVMSVVGSLHYRDCVRTLAQKQTDDLRFESGTTTSPQSLTSSTFSIAPVWETSVTWNNAHGKNYIDT
ncbi:hypothetical protein ARMSODRAFT_1007437 [Armillaria solidipes]|uniref:DUF6534 domain-containing protein n=1 Tax=Armillaria solidipes TaxID=1076256 RepID=A0A2H3B4X2_9AGAR|nr:hypothetical protein ARMSODRAFT_1007437 [Armillaria solidipes]